MWTVIVLWSVLNAAGIGSLWVYAHTAGDSATAPQQWPRDTSLHRTTGKATLVLLIHPKCPCTDATIDNLTALMEHAGNKVEADVVVFQPTDEPLSWADTKLVRRAGALPHTSIFMDKGEKEIDRFGSQTSGQALLYDLSGKLIFAGGLTSARGHPGDNLGIDNIASWLQGHELVTASYPVYGCQLHGGKCPDSH